MPIYALTSQPFYDSLNQSYRKIIVINKKPEGPLQNITKQISIPKLSPFDSISICCPPAPCIQVIMSPQNPNLMLCINNIPSLFQFLMENGYTIDSNITKIMQDSEIKMDNKLLCYIFH